MALGIDEAWNSVALEERIELISRAQANGVLSALIFALMMGAVGYGFGQIGLLYAGILGGIVLMPVFTSRSWRKHKPVIILNHLAARSVARRYAFGSGIKDLGIVLLFRGFMEQEYESESDRAFEEKDRTVGLDDSNTARKKEVWICLLRGGIVAISERIGGAKLEYAAPVDKDMICEVHEPQGPGDVTTVSIEGSGKLSGKKAVFTSYHPAALYVFSKQTARLIYEANELAIRVAQFAEENRRIANF